MDKKPRTSIKQAIQELAKVPFSESQKKAIWDHLLETSGVKSEDRQSETKTS